MTDTFMLGIWICHIKRKNPFGLGLGPRFYEVIRYENMETLQTALKYDVSRIDDKALGCSPKFRRFVTNRKVGLNIRAIPKIKIMEKNIHIFTSIILVHLLVFSILITIWWTCEKEDVTIMWWKITSFLTYHTWDTDFW